MDNEKGKLRFLFGFCDVADIDVCAHPSLWTTVSDITVIHVRGDLSVVSLWGKVLVLNINNPPKF